LLQATYEQTVFSVFNQLRTILHLFVRGIWYNDSLSLHLIVKVILTNFSQSISLIVNELILLQ